MGSVKDKTVLNLPLRYPHASFALSCRSVSESGNPGTYHFSILGRSNSSFVVRKEIQRISPLRGNSDRPVSSPVACNPNTIKAHRKPKLFFFLTASLCPVKPPGNRKAFPQNTTICCRKIRRNPHAAQPDWS